MADLLSQPMPAQHQVPAVAGAKRGRDELEAAHGTSSFLQMQQQHIAQQPSLPRQLPAYQPARVSAPVFQHTAPDTLRRHPAGAEALLWPQQAPSGASPSLRRTNVTPALQRTANADALLRALDNMAGILFCFATEPLCNPAAERRCPDAQMAALCIAEHLVTSPALSTV